MVDETKLAEQLGRLTLRYARKRPGKTAYQRALETGKIKPKPSQRLLDAARGFYGPRNDRR